LTRLGDLASELSSKNAGNFHLAFDIVFENAEIYRRVVDSGAFTAERVAPLYGMPAEEILGIINFDPGNAIKVTMRRLHPSGDPGETDVFGAQQYPPLLELEIP
jgi:Domain of unknown function (DUF4387)